MTASTQTAAAHWADRDAVLYHAGVRPERRACVDMRSGENLSFRELDMLVGRCAGWLRKCLGNPAGERVATLLRNGIDALVLMYACERVGAIYTPLNWRLTGPELKLLTADCEPALLIADTEFAEAAWTAFPPSAATFLVEPRDNAFRTAVLACAPEAAQPGSPDQPCIMLYTSGTTGRPKGVLLTRANVFWAAFNHATIGQINAESALLCDSPMFHTVGLIATCRCVLQQGGAVLLADMFQPSLSLKRLRNTALGITHYFCVPQMAQMLCEDSTYERGALNHLKAFFVGGAPLPAALCERLLDDGVPVSNGYGLTETCTIAHMPLDQQGVRARPLSVGLQGPAVDVRIVDTNGQDAKAGETGEIWVRGPAVTPGYWRQAEATAAAFTCGWFRTGDAGRRDEQGYLTIVDRWKDMYISGGENVYPAEVEMAIASLPGVREVAIVGVPSERWGEAGLAFIACDPNAKLTEADILVYCRDRLAGYKRPVQVRFVDSLPRTATGKIRKDSLRAEAMTA